MPAHPVLEPYLGGFEFKSGSISFASHLSLITLNSSDFHTFRQAQLSECYKHTMSDASRLKATVYVGGLDNAVNERILTDAFIPFGEVIEVSIPKPEPPSSREPHRGFGYVEFEAPEDAREAIDNMDQSELFGRVLKVAQAKPQKDANEGLGSKVAVWEQVRRLPFSCAIEKVANRLFRRAGLRNMAQPRRIEEQVKQSRKMLTKRHRQKTK